MQTASSPAQEDAEALAAVISALRDRTGVDFDDYRRPTLYRRVRNRMVSVGAATFVDYLERMRSSAEEAAALLDRVTIKVSRFYRNAGAFDRIRGEVLPALAARCRGRPLRAWSAGCGHGEEAYTLAMLLEEAGIEGDVTASDIDPRALEAAQAGVFHAAALHELPAQLLERYLEPVAGKVPRWRVAEAVRRRVSFQVEDLTAHAQTNGGQYDLACCRNVLIYLTAPAQQRTLANVVARVAPSGWLLLGEAEWPAQSVLPALDVVCARHRLFRARERIVA